ncbi:MAG TPA: heavy metal-responsive transcriptional regulator [Thermomicrobiales bacterium]|nr:heavy metal-responsive transcriptional regulator [Thermomicrobiales bacterium]
MRIGQLAALTGLNPRTLRYYERIGLLAPARRTAAGYRLYTAREARRLRFIRRAQGLGLSLREIAAILAVRDAGAAPCRQVQALAEAKVAEIDRRIAELRRLRAELAGLAERAADVEPACAAGPAICLAFEPDPAAPA